MGEVGMWAKPTAAMFSSAHIGKIIFLRKWACGRNVALLRPLFPACPLAFWGMWAAQSEEWQALAHMPT